MSFLCLLLALLSQNENSFAQGLVFGSDKSVLIAEGGAAPGSTNSSGAAVTPVTTGSDSGLAPSATQNVSGGVLPAPAPTPDTSLIPMFDPEVIRLEEKTVDEKTKARWKSLIPSLEGKVKADYKNKSKHLNLGKAYLNAGNYEKAIEHLKVSSDIKSPDTYFLLAEAYRKNKKYLDEIRTLSELAQRYERNPKVFAQLGTAYHHTNKDDEAVIHLKKAIELSPANEESYIALVKIYSDIKDKDEMRVLLEDMNKKFGDKPYIFTELCKLYVMQSYFEEARTVCQKATTVDPKQVENHVFLGISIRDAGNPKQAEKILVSAAKHFPKSEFAQWQAAQISETLKNWAGAAKFYAAGAKANPKSVRCLVGWAKTSFQIAKFQEALDAFKKACSQDRTVLTEFRKHASILRTQKESAWQSKFELAIETCK